MSHGTWKQERGLSISSFHRKILFQEEWAVLGYLELVQTRDPVDRYIHFPRISLYSSPGDRTLSAQIGNWTFPRNWHINRNIRPISPPPSQLLTVIFLRLRKAYLGGSWCIWRGWWWGWRPVSWWWSGQLHSKTDSHSKTGGCPPVQHQPLERLGGDWRW